MASQGGSGSGLPGPPGPAGPAGKQGPPGSSDDASLVALSVLDGAGFGTLTSVGLAAPPEFVVSGSPVTTSGTLTLTKATETANTVWAGPTSGPAAAPTFRTLTAADIAGATTGRTTFTPTVTFATPGDLSVAYTTQTGAYVQVGPMVLFWYTLTFTPTYTTASGNFQISVPPVALTDQTWAWPIRILSSPTWPTGTTVVARPQGGVIVLATLASGAASSLFTTTQIVSGAAYNVNFSGFYF